MAREIGFTVDTDTFNKKMEERRELSRQSAKFSALDTYQISPDIKTIFTGYEELETQAKVLFVDENKVVFDKSPFYFESGGQVSDTGEIIFDDIKFRVTNLVKIGDAIVHIVDKTFPNAVGKEALLRVDRLRRLDTMRNHSATHLLHEALVQVLGSHVRQAGSLVAPDYLRFDFNHFAKAEESQLKEIESLVNEKIFEALPVRTDIMSLEDARTKTKAKMFFGEKYGEIVRVVSMGDFSAELCGGTHVRNTNEIGIFKILSEQSIAAGVRRIEAVTARGVYKYLLNLNDEIQVLKNKTLYLEDTIRKLQKEFQKIEKERIRREISEWVSSARTFDSIRYIVREVDVENLDELRDLAEEVRNTFGKNGIAFLFLPKEEKLYIACSVTDDLISTYPAGKLVNQVAQKLGGRGGGKNHLATAGTKLTDEYKTLIKDFDKIFSSILT